MTALSLYELNSLVRSTLAYSLEESYWIQAELNEVHINSGHCYVELIQKSAVGNQIIAKARGVIWANRFKILKPYFEETTHQTFTSTIKVLIEVSIQFHELYGYSLVIQDIDPTYTLGDLALRRQEILRRLKEEGVLNLNKELTLPQLTKRIAIISSSTAAGYGDFCNQLANNPHHYYFETTVFQSIMQGDGVEQSMLVAMDRILERQDDFDAVVIIRGGGASSDLLGFETYLLAASCAQFPLPIITGIGHERDETILDIVAHTHVKTPTAAAEFLINHMQNAEEELLLLKDHLHRSIAEKLNLEKKRLNDAIYRLPSATLYRLRYEHHQLQKISSSIPNATGRHIERNRQKISLLEQKLWSNAQSLLTRKKHQIELLAQKIQLASPVNLLAKGYSLTLLNGKTVKDVSSLKNGDQITTVFLNGQTLSTITKIKKDNNTSSTSS